MFESTLKAFVFVRVRSMRSLNEAAHWCFKDKHATVPNYSSGGLRTISVASRRGRAEKISQ
ncbi:hypothetical protein T265_11870 [Opisthorchis viverrini]|uniref:Uncharacterized protein n=1 Tax=Opisthorchis viverrini TaxID=6198 RepID=A0A074YXD7_OPIVI|nr:hypothetical protein T265_11870 [Opisthorchis viverrini]KER19318.1 hypothetical protein T265_11870 [Opisthorchis viverrini]